MVNNNSNDGDMAGSAASGSARSGDAETLTSVEAGHAAAWPHAIGIGAIAREIGVTKDTLRVWERRYGFPRPARTPGGERVYPAEQVRKLRLIKRLLDAGHRPGKVLPQSYEALIALSEQAGIGAHAPDQVLDALLGLVSAGRVDALRDELMSRMVRHGLERFVIDVAAPLSARIGNACATGALQAHQRHLFSETLQNTLKTALRLLADVRRDAASRPLVLLATFPGEAHGPGILMAEAMFALAGCPCVTLGSGTPIAGIVEAALARHADIVALSCPENVDARQIGDGLAELRASLPPRVQLCAGGAPALRHRAPPGVYDVSSPAHVEAAVTQWRRHAVL